MTGSVKGLFKRKWSGISKGKPHESIKKEGEQWDKRGKKLDYAYGGGAQKEAAALAAQEDKVIPMPDEEEIKRNKRRGNAARGGGRASTILTSGDSDTLGG